jgi:uncharacterized protein YggE
VDSELIVEGVGEVRAKPDLASVRVAVEAEAQSREKAYRTAAATAAAVDGVLESFDSAIDRVTTATLWLAEKTRYHEGEYRRIGWQASRVSLVDICETSRVGDVVQALAGAGANIKGLSWVAVPTNEAFALARRRAGEDARARAEQYAQALGVELRGVAWAAEPGLRRDGRSHGDIIGGPMVASAMREEAAEEAIDITPEEITIEATIEVGYRI